ncbi:MAG: anti-sigma factor family protein [bacterium]
MNHSKLKSYIGAFVDAELSSRKMKEIEKHLEICPECRREYEAEREIKRILQEKVQKERAPLHLRDKVLRAVEDRERAKKPGMHHPLNLAVAVGAALALIAIPVFYLLRENASLSPLPALITQLMVEHDRHSVVQEPAQMPTHDAKQAASWIEKKLKTPVVLPREGGELHLQGVGLIQLGGKKIACFLYEAKGTRISLFVFEGRGISFQSHGAGAFQKIQHGDHSALIWIRKDLIYALIADMEMQDLIPYASQISGCDIPR